MGYSPALGFIHTVKPLSFVYDIADLYKAETTIPAAFAAVAAAQESSDSQVRQKCREKFTEYRLIRRIIQDIDQILGYSDGEVEVPAVSYLWDDKADWVEGGQDWLEESV